MKMRVRRFSPWQNAKVMGVLAAVVSLFFAVPAAVVFSIHPPVGPMGQPIGMPGFAYLLFPLLYFVLGYVATLVWCAVYNGLSKYTGGIEVEMDGL